MAADNNDEAPRIARTTLLAGGIGAVVALASRALGRPESARAADGAPLVLGVANDATARTTVSTPSGPAFAATAAGGTGLTGSSTTHPGVHGDSQAGFGVAGVTTAKDKAGVLGESRDPAGTGVWGRNPGGVGVLGASRTGTGVLARSERGVALHVAGPVRFRSTGVAIVRDGEFMTTVFPQVPVTEESHVLATLNGPDPERFVGGAAFPVTLWFVATNPGNDSFDIVLTDRVQHDIRVAWFLLGA
jgi:hypothetical protein